MTKDVFRKYVSDLALCAGMRTLCSDDWEKQLREHDPELARLFVESCEAQLRLFDYAKERMR